MTAHHVVITGMGVVSAAGLDIESVWTRVRGGNTPERHPPNVLRENGLVGAIAPVTDAAVVGALPARLIQDTDRSTHLALLATRQAVADAQLDISVGSQRTAVVVGTGFGAIGSITHSAGEAALHPSRSVSPLAIPMGMQNATAFWLAREVKAHGCNMTVSTACSSGAMAILMARQLILAGDADVVVACGVDAPLAASVLRAWASMRVMAPGGPGTGAFRPFDAARSGFILGEGAAALVCESESSARRRGARLHGRVAGGGATCDATSLTRPNADTQAQAIKAALESADIQPDFLAFVNAHGTGTRQNDPTETTALHAALGAVVTRVPVQASKPFFGHTMGASGVIEFMLGLWQLRHGTLHPTPNLTDVAPDCALNHIRDWTPTNGRPYFISNSFGLGGNNVVLVGHITETDNGGRSGG